MLDHDGLESDWLDYSDSYGDFSTYSKHIQVLH